MTNYRNLAKQPTITVDTDYLWDLSARSTFLLIVWNAFLQPYYPPVIASWFFTWNSFKQVRAVASASSGLICDAPFSQFKT